MSLVCSIDLLSLAAHHSIPSTSVASPRLARAQGHPRSPLPIHLEILGHQKLQKSQLGDKNCNFTYFTCKNCNMLKLSKPSSFHFVNSGTPPGSTLSSGLASATSSSLCVCILIPLAVLESPRITAFRESQPLNVITEEIIKASSCRTQI